MTIERIRDFRRRLQRESAEEIAETAHGVAYLSPSIPDVYDHNYLSVDAPPVGAAELAVEADDPLARSFHRRVIAERATPGLDADFAELGFSQATHLVLVHDRAPDRLVDTARIVREAPLDELIPARTEAILAEHWGDEEIARQLNEAKRRTAAAVTTRFFAVLHEEAIAGWCEVYSQDGIAQIEDVEVLQRHRGLGLGRALVQHALVEAQKANDLVFLEALADDWPRILYGKLGFTLADRRDFYTKLPHPLTRLRLRTPRLELRLPTLAELRELYAVAAGGIHDPAAMPFSVSWTDTLNERDFVAHHLDTLAGSTPDDWTLELVVFSDGRPIGVQTIRAQQFRETGTVDTGSWLGRAWQGKGLGAEMRSAVLTYAFRDLRALRATSGAIDGNGQSLGVSRKLGYAETGMHTVSPRGIPVEHVDLLLTPDRFRPAVETTAGGLETARTFLGVL